MEHTLNSNSSLSHCSPALYWPTPAQAAMAQPLRGRQNSAATKHARREGRSNLLALSLMGGLFPGHCQCALRSLCLCCCELALCLNAGTSLLHLLFMRCTGQARVGIHLPAQPKQHNSAALHTHTKLKDQAAQTVVDVKPSALLLRYKFRCATAATSTPWHRQQTSPPSPEPQCIPAGFLKLCEWCCGNHTLVTDSQ